MTGPRIALIHALAHSVEPINTEMARHWPQAVRMNLLDDSLSADLHANGRGLDEAMHARFETLAAYAESTGAQAILFTCSAFGPCIEAVAAPRPHMPVLKPNEAMVADAARLGGRLGLIASFAPTLQSMPPEFPPEIEMLSACVPEALEALNRGDVDAHDRLVAQAAQGLVSKGCHAIALAQFSMARAASLVQTVVDVPVLTTPGSAVQALKRRVGAST